MENISRRELLKRTAIAAGGALFLSRPINAWAMESEATSKVVLIRNQKLYADGDTPDAAVCE
ncbi:MAG: twin-arginine translocation signal domain-containing protein, partial [Prevotellaceae bacterium]|nr:twin-arginine translocation signal domain-containing protein [Prevotellaceae bacterium]